MSFFASLKSSWYLGKGNSAFNNGSYDKALSYYLSALECAKETESCGELAVRKEAIAATYLKLKDYEKARLCASESLEIYEGYYSKDISDLGIKSINRVKKLLNEITSIEIDTQKTGDL